MKKKKTEISRREFLRGCAVAGAALAVAQTGIGVPVTPAESTALVPGVPVYPRAAWSAFLPRPGLLKPALVYTRLTVHHAGNTVNTHRNQEMVVHDLNGVLEAHLQKQYGDIAYHFIIDYAGRIWEGRSLIYEGTHVSGWNEQNLGVMLMGNFEEQEPSSAQVTSLFELVGGLRDKFEIPAQSVYGHCDLAQSICPGKHLYHPFVKTLSQGYEDEG